MIKSLLTVVLAVGFVAAPLAAFADDTIDPCMDGEVSTPCTSVPVVCPKGTVPGWLDENGNPTSCVGDSATPGTSDTPATPVTQAKPATPQPVKELAYTGPVTTWLAVPGGLLLLAGASLLVVGRKAAA